MGGDQGRETKRNQDGRITAQLRVPKQPAPSATSSAALQPAGAPPPLVVDEALDVRDTDPLYEELDATDPEFDSDDPLDTRVMLAAFDDATEVQDG